MLNLFIALLFASMMGEYYFISVRVETIDYALDSLSPALVSGGVYLYADPPYFDNDALTSALYSYLDMALPNYSREDYELTLDYYDAKSGDVCTDMCSKVVVTFTTKVSAFYTYSKSMYYEITGGNN